MAFEAFVSSTASPALAFAKEHHVALNCFATSVLRLASCDHSEMFHMFATSLVALQLCNRVVVALAWIATRDKSDRSVTKHHCSRLDCNTDQITKLNWSFGQDQRLESVNCIVITDNKYVVRLLSASMLMVRQVYLWFLVWLNYWLLVPLSD